jgi:hypothetical protein
MSATFPLSCREASLAWILSGCLAQQRHQLCLTTTLSLPDGTTSKHKPVFFPDDIQSSPDRTTSVHGHYKSPSSQDLTWRKPPAKHHLKSLRCHHFETRCGHLSRCWPCSLLLNIRDQERHTTTSPEKLALWQGRINSLIYWPPHLYPFCGRFCPEAADDRIHRRLRTIPRPYMDTKSPSSQESTRRRLPAKH